MDIYQQQLHYHIYRHEVFELSARRGLSLREAFDILFDRVPPNTVSLYIAEIGLESLPSMKNLANLKILDVSGNKLTRLPQLPEGLLDLTCQSNRLWSLKNTPSTVTSIAAQKNEICTLYGVSPKTEYLYLQNNHLERIDSFPPNLKKCHVSNNRLEHLPPLPATVLELCCHNNDLAELPFPLPPSLHTLSCFNNPRLTCLPSLPSGLQKLDVENCNISRIPKLPDTLHLLDVRGNPITHMVNLPPVAVFSTLIVISGTPIGKILSPANIPSVSLPHSYDVMRSNLQILNRFRELYYTLKYKNQFRQWLWIKVRLPRIEQAHHPDRLQEALEQEGGEEADLEAVLQSLG
jgi:Leucine-rich repeat (LRR) protein